MFITSIEKNKEYTRPIHTIIRLHGSREIEPAAATMFFVNELGYAVTCKHVAELIGQTEFINDRHKKFSDELAKLPSGGKYNRRVRDLEEKYSLKNGIITQIKNNFMNCVDKMDGLEIMLHPTLDLAIIHFTGFNKITYNNYAVFLKDTTQIKQGKYLCRLGYPFPEFSNYRLNEETDDIEWTQEGNISTPTFPIDGIITRKIILDNNIIGIEMSTPGLRGQSGGPLFDQNGIVYGMQSSTHHLHLGFDIKDMEIREGGKIKKVSNNPFLHLGNCVHADIIKDFLKENNVKFYEEDEVTASSSLKKTKKKKISS